MTTNVFTMNAIGTKFVNSKDNPVRLWFARMMIQLGLAANNNILESEISIKMHPDLWFCIAKLYSYGRHYQQDENYIFLTKYDNVAARCHEEYLTLKKLPILGAWRSVLLDDTQDISSVFFFVSINGEDKYSGIIKNIKCYIETDEIEPDRPRLFWVRRVWARMIG